MPRQTQSFGFHIIVTITASKCSFKELGPDGIKSKPVPQKPTKLT
jgi:hypothetical protein